MASARLAVEPAVRADGELLALARSQHGTSNATDLLIIATASATGRTLTTVDRAQASLARIAGSQLPPDRQLAAKSLRMAYLDRRRSPRLEALRTRGDAPR